MNNNALPKISNLQISKFPLLNRFWDLKYLFLFALILRLGYMVLMMGQLSEQEIFNLYPDTIRYVNIGSGIAEGTWVDEEAVLIFGPGYGMFLGLFFILFGQHAISLLVFQALISSLSCVMIYYFGLELTENKMVGLIAGYLAAVSFTSISLCNVVLSDCLFFFVFLAANLLFIKGLKSGRRREFVLSGIILGAAILIRSIGQFWPLAMVILVFIWPLESSRFSNRVSILKRAIWAPLIAFVFIMGWSARNLNEHNLFMPAFTSAGGLANVAGFTLERITGRSSYDIRVGWEEEYLKKNGKTSLAYEDRNILYSDKVRKVVMAHPIQFMRTYFSIIWENMNAVNELYRVQLPEYCWQIVGFMYRMRDNYYYYHWVTFFSLLSFVILLWRRNWRVFLTLVIFYGYFVAMMGFTRWQGSRLFYPAEITKTILIALLIIEIIRLIGKLFNRESVRT